MSYSDVDREVLKRLLLEGEAAYLVVNAGTDFRLIEQRVIADMAHDTGFVFVDLESPSGEIPGLFVIDSKPKPPAPAVKQNGRSAEYLKHDTTKSSRHLSRKRR